MQRNSASLKERSCEGSQRGASVLAICSDSARVDDSSQSTETRPAAVLAPPYDAHKPTTAERLQQMDGLRGIAMLFVFLGHFAMVWTKSVHPGGAAGVFLRLVDADATFGSSLFMLLSGFFAYGSLARGKKSFGEFLRGRIWRLYPLYLIMTFVYVLGSLVFPKMSKLPADPHVATLFILQTLLFLPGLLHVKPLMDVAWTLSFVILFYFVEGAVARLFKLWGISRLSRFVLLAGASLLWAQAGDSTGWWQPRTAIFWVGMALSEAVGAMSGERLAWATRLTAPAAVVTILGVWLRTDLMMRRDPLIAPLAVERFMITAVTLFAFIWVAYFGPQWWKHLLSGQQLRKLGAASYSFYLTHGFAVKAFSFGIIPWLGTAARMQLVFGASQIVGLALSIAIARVVYTMVESPLSKLAPKPYVTSQVAFWRTETTF